MNRVTKNKFAYLLLIVAAIVFALGALVLLGLSGWTVVLVSLVLLLPGRVSAVLLRDLYRARRLRDRESFREAIEAGEKFLDALKAQPWRRCGLYFAWGIYTWNVEAMARNNLAAAHMELGELDVAESQLERAVTLDRDYPIPYYNLAIIQAAKGDETACERLLSLAANRGFTNSLDDRLIDRVGSAYAALQSLPR